MNSRKIFLLVGALVVAAVTAFMARSLIVGAPAPQAAAAVAAARVDGPEVLVATRSLPVGTILDATAVKYQPWPKELVENAYFIHQGGFDSKTLLGTVVRNPITAGQPITQGALVKPGDRGFLAAALGAGMRAVTVPVSQQSSVAGFVFPGDRIDLVLTQNVVGGGDGAPLKVAETIMRNLRVLATDQRTDNTVDENGKMQVRTFSMVTLEATPKMAEQIAVSQTLGSLSLSLRSLADNQSELDQAIASGAVNVPSGSDPKAEKAMIAKVAAQPSAGSSSFETGADVSRFQRSTVPGKPIDTSTPAGIAAATKGPVVRVAHGNTVTDVAVGGKK
jgi:pilus assembly protein CpaB